MILLCCLFVFLHLCVCARCDRGAGCPVGGCRGDCGAGGWRCCCPRLSHWHRHHGLPVWSGRSWTNWSDFAAGMALVVATALSTATAPFSFLILSPTGVWLDFVLEPAGYKMNKCVGAIEEFEFLPLSSGKHLHLTIAVTGWLCSGKYSMYDCSPPM